MKSLHATFGALLFTLLAGSALAAGADLGPVEKQPTNWVAISMFGDFVIATLFTTWWAAAKTKSAADFYTAGGGIAVFQNGLGLRRPDLFHRLSGGLARHHVPDG